MKKRVQVTQTMSQAEIDERDRIIPNITHLGQEIAAKLSTRENLLHSIGVHAEAVYSNEEYQRPRFLRKPVTETRLNQESMTLVLMMTRPHVWLTTDGRFAMRRQRNDPYIINLSELHISTLRALEESMTTYLHTLR